MGYFREAVKGISWTIGLRTTTRFLALFKVVIVARLIGPDEFGIYGVAALVLAFLEVITETGINVFLIQEDKKIKEYINTAWVVSIFRGILISLGIVLLSLPIASFFRSEAARDVLLLTALVPLVRGFINPAVVSFQKDLKFNKEFYFWSSIYFVDTVVALLSAYITLQAESIIYGMLVAAVLEVVMSMLLIKPRPRFIINKEHLRSVIHRGKWITASSIFNYLFMNSDDFVVGRLMSTTSLGHYQMAYKIGILPITEIHSTLAKVSLPIYSKIRGDLNRLKIAFYKVFGISLLTSLIFIVVIFLFSERLVILLLGEDWMIVVPVIKVLSIFAAVRSVTGSAGTVLLSVKRQEYRAASSLLGILGIGLTIVPFVNNMGILGAAYSALTGAFFELPIAFYFLNKVLSKKVS